MTRTTSDEAAEPAPWGPMVKPLVRPVTELVRTRYTPARMRTLDLPLAEIHRDALRELNAGFTRQRDDRKVSYLSGPKFRGAYLLYYSFTGAATTQAVLQRGEERGAWAHLPTDRPIRVLDLGAGPLTASLGLAMAWPERALEITAVDGAKAALQDGAALMKAIRPDVQVRLEAGNLRDGALRRRLGGGYDVVLVANVLNEFREVVRREDTQREPGAGRSPAERLLRDVIRTRLAANGRVVVIEPGARSPSRLLIALRDRLVADETAGVVAPCLGAQTCPLSAAHSRDWCHAEQPWKRPRPVAASDRVLGRRRDVLKYSYLILARPGEVTPAPAATWRVIGGPMSAAPGGGRGRPGGPLRRYVCGPVGRVVVTDRYSSAALHDALRGDLLTIPGDPSPAEPRPGRRRGELELPFPRRPGAPARRPQPARRPKSGGAEPRAADSRAGKPKKGRKTKAKVDRQDRPFYSKRKKHKPGKKKS